MAWYYWRVLLVTTYNAFFPVFRVARYIGLQPITHFFRFFALYVAKYVVGRGVILAIIQNNTNYLFIFGSLYIVEDGLDSFEASAAAGVTLEFWYRDAAVPEYFFIDSEYFGALQIVEFGIDGNIY